MRTISFITFHIYILLTKTSSTGIFTNYTELSGLVSFYCLSNKRITNKLAEPKDRWANIKGIQFDWFKRTFSFKRANGFIQ